MVKQMGVYTQTLTRNLANMTTSISTCMLPNSLCREMVKHHVHVHLCVWNCKVRCMLRHMCTCVYSILNHACKRALYFASCLAPPSATAANACEMLLASLRRSLTLAEPSCEHICKFMNCNINMTIAGGWQHKKMMTTATLQVAGRDGIGNGQGAHSLDGIGNGQGAHRHQHQAAQAQLQLTKCRWRTRDHTI